MPVAVDRHRDEPRPGRPEALQRAQVGRLLDHDGVARLDQRAGDEIERLLRSRGDDDLLGRDRGPAPAS